jgi:dTDP-4-dehydrorhamnose reductase
VGRLEAGEPIAGVTDQRITPVFLDDAIHALHQLIAQRYPGLIHVAATDWTTPYEYARSIARRLGLDAGLVQPTPFEAFSATRPAQRPKYSWLDVTRFTNQVGPSILRTFEAELDAWVAQISSTVSRV